MSQVNELQTKLRAITDDAMASFGELTPAQLNWKPGQDRWSVAQCLDHLLTTNRSYEPAIRKLLSGDASKTFWERLPLFPSLWASLLIKSLDPKSTRKIKAPKSFEPAASDLPATIVKDFAAHQAQIIDFMEAAFAKQLEQTVITSPAAKFVTYTVRDAFRVVVVHEQRHLQQAKRIMGEAAFPR